MERPYVVDGFCNPEFSFSDYRTCNPRPDPPPEAVAVVVRGGLRRVAEIVERYPESVAVGRLASPRGAVVTVVESACCVRPKVLGNSLLFASSQLVRLELTFAEIFVYYVEAGPPGPDGSAVYRRRVDVRRFRRGIRLKPLHPALIEYLSSRELLQNYHYWIDPPNRLVVHLDDALVYVTFEGGPKVDVRFLRPTILAYSAGYAEKVARKLGLIK